MINVAHLTSCIHFKGALMWPFPELIHSFGAPVPKLNEVCLVKSLLSFSCTSLTEFTQSEEAVLVFFPLLSLPAPL